MANASIKRTDDTAATLQSVATVSFDDGAGTVHAQQCVLVDATTPTQKLAVDASGHLQADIAAASVTVPISAASLPLPSGASTAAKQPALGTAGTASADVITVQGIASMTKLLVTPDANSAVNVAQVGGTNTVSGGTAGSLAVGGVQAHDAADSGNNPVKVGIKAVAHGANPTAVAAGDITDMYANRHGIPFVLGGHPNIIRTEFTFLDADGAQTNAALVTVGAGAKIVVTHVEVSIDEATTVCVGVRIGLAAATLTAAATTGIAGIVFSHLGGIPGGRYSAGDGNGILAIGADNEDLRITSDDPVSGGFRVIVSYFTVES